MSEAVSVLAELAVKPGQSESFKSVVQDLVESSSKEPGTLTYEYFVSGDGNKCHVHERYADSASALSHITNGFGKHGERFLSAVDIVSITVYGEPTDELRTLLAGYGASFMGPLNGFTR